MTRFREVDQGITYRAELSIGLPPETDTFGITYARVAAVLKGEKSVDERLVSKG